LKINKLFKNALEKNNQIALKAQEEYRIIFSYAALVDP